MEARNASEEEGLSQEQTEKLLQFREITNTEDLEECKRILLQHGWNVESAVQSTFVDRTPPLPQANPAPVYNENPLRRRNIGSISPPIPLRTYSHTNVYEARRLARLRQPQGFFGWSYYIIALPFRFTWTTLFGIVKFFLRLFIPDPRTRALTSPQADVQNFISEYEELFGTRHPEFFRGSYGESHNEAKRQLKFLLVYLHDSDHDDTADFCNNTLSNEDVIQLVQNNFLFWACSIAKSEGYRVSRGLRENTHPFLATICPMQGKMTVVGRFEGPLTSQEFMEQISAVIEKFEPMMIAARAERAERDMTQQLRNEQDEAYQKSLLQDKEKEKKKREEEELRLRKEEEMAEKLRKREEAEEKHLKRKQSCKEFLLQEPQASSSDAVKLMIKLPDGSRLTRVFLSTEPVKAIHDYIFSQDNAPRQFQVVTNFPRKVIPGCSTEEILAQEDRERHNTKPKIIDLSEQIENENSSSGIEINNITIAQAGLKSSEVLFVQAIDESDDEDSSS